MLGVCGVFGWVAASAAALSAPAATRTVTEVEAAKMFGRLSDKLLLQDVEGSGTDAMKNCCHGGCDNCPYSRIFDEVRAGRPKWVAAYVSRELIDGRRHEAPALAIFDGTAAVDAAAFSEKLSALPFRPCMGPKLTGFKPEDPVDEDAARHLFDLVADGAETLDADAWASGVKRLTGADHGAMWGQFEEALGK